MLWSILCLTHHPLMNIQYQSFIMSLIYTVIGREDRVIVEYTSYSGNFTVTVGEILKMCKREKKYMKYSVNNYIFYVLYDDVIYLVMCDTKYRERIAFGYLEKIRKIFVAAYAPEKIANAKMYEFMEFAKILKSNMQLYASPEQVDNIARLERQTQEVSQIINEDLTKVINRGSKIELLVKKTEVMSSLSLDMKNTSRQVKNEMTWQNWKMRVLVGLAICAGVYILMVIICGGFLLRGCFG